MWMDSASKSARVVAVAACFSVVSNGDFAHAAEPSATRGRELAVRLCSSCHVVSGAATPAVPEGIATFRGIANSPGQSAERISNVLILPHLPMPDNQLTRDEIQDILAYLETLRTNPEVPPLIAPVETKPPTPSKT
jgi:cytochrome c